MAFVYPNHIRTIENESHDEYMFTAMHFDDLLKGEAALYLLDDDILRPLSAKDDAVMDTLHHHVVFHNHNKQLHATVKPHTAALSAFESTMEADTVKMTFTCGSELDFQRLVIVDVTSKEERIVPIEMTGGTATVGVPFQMIMDTQSRRRFMLETGTESPRRFLPMVDNLEASDLKSPEQVLFNSAWTTAWFYRRKDGQLGFKCRYPILGRAVTDITDTDIAGYLSNLESFVGCTPHLAFVERYSGAVHRVPIKETFTVDLKGIPLTSLKSKDKTIIDLFVELFDTGGEVIRRGKIKYLESDYRKDNYYSWHEQMDASGTHHHLVTTTPYDNLKIESFLIPVDIQIPAHTEQKDMNMWLIGERYDTAQDNGYALFSWLRQHASVNAYYVIEAPSEDYQRSRMNHMSSLSAHKPTTMLPAVQVCFSEHMTLKICCPIKRHVASSIMRIH
ncbi:hypothetical protein [Salinicoccus sp. CNSTN-B1]